MINYSTFKNKQTKNFNEFISKNVFFAFSNEQFKKGLNEFNLTLDNYKEHIASFYGGGFILKSKIKEYNKISNKMNKNLRKYLSNYKQLVNALTYEMFNHECGYTGNYLQGVKALGISTKEFNKSKKIQKAYIQAKNTVYNHFINSEF